MSISATLKQFLPGIISSGFKNKYLISKDTRKLNSIRQIECESGNLRSKNGFLPENLFESAEIEAMWDDSKKEIGIFKIPDGSGGINHGDRKALYYLISKLKPSSVLEVGTHIGASTMHIALALYISQIKKGQTATLTSVDILDVNSDVIKPWLKYGMNYSPAEMVNKLNYGSFVRFETDSSLNYATNCTQKFDFIFLDGNHTADTVYQEIPMALKLLNPKGVILLHDYFPSLKPLWSDGSVIPGPYLATKRFAKEGADLIVVELGKLPWPTKLGSNVTSFALLLRKS
jgi:predicted O-methyltransferase YrrM